MGCLIHEIDYFMDCISHICIVCFFPQSYFHLLSLQGGYTLAVYVLFLYLFYFYYIYKYICYDPGVKLSVS